MDQRSEVVNRLNRHQPQKWRRWLCSCERRLPCPIRAEALRMLRAWNSRDREVVVMQKLRLRARIDQIGTHGFNQRHPWPTSQQPTWPPR